MQVREKVKREEEKKEKRERRERRVRGVDHCVSSNDFGFGGSKSRLAKALGAEPSGQMRDDKLHAVVARMTCPSQDVQNTPTSDHFWKLRCRKSALRCGGKHISKSKCAKHLSVGPLLEVEMSKKCTPLWREAHFEDKMYKTPPPGSAFRSWHVEKVHAVVARSTFPSQSAKKTHVRNTFGRLDVVLCGSPFPKEASQNCFVFDIVNFEIEEVSQKCFVFEVVK